MSDGHLDADDLNLYIDKELEQGARSRLDKHLANCALCRGRVAREERLSRALRATPRAEPPRDLAARISSAVQVHTVQEQLRRSRMPFIGVAMFFSVLLFVWFGFQMIVALADNGTLDFLWLLSNRPDVFSAYSVDAVWALVEAVPLGEIALTLFALFTVIVLAQQWIDTIRPHASLSKSR